MPKNICIALSSIGAELNCVETDNRSGIVDKILFGYADDVKVWPNLPEGVESRPMNLSSAGGWKGDLSMKNGCCLYELNITDETGELKITDQGEKGSKSFLYELEISRAKMNRTMFGFENAIKDAGMVILVRDRNGNWYLMGDEMVPAMKVDSDGSTTGKTGTDQNKTTMKFQYTCPRKLVYAGDIDSLLVPAHEEQSSDSSDSSDSNEN